MDKKSRDLIMGKLYLKNKDYKMAEKSFSEYLNSNPENFEALKMLAQVHEHLNDTAKAFELYQRCFLSQPDRKGVLLDMCRLLLINDPRLNNVDQKKWLKLAVQTFPSNPIVINLRDSLPNNQDLHPGKITTEDKILEKLTLLEDHVKNLEDKVESVFVRFDGMEDKLESILVRFNGMEDKLKGLENRTIVDNRKETPQKVLESKPAAPVNLTNNFGSLKLESKPQTVTTPMSLFGSPKLDIQPSTAMSPFAPLNLGTKPAATNDFSLFKSDSKPAPPTVAFGSFMTQKADVMPNLSNSFMPPKVDSSPAQVAVSSPTQATVSSPVSTSTSLGNIAPKLDIKPLSIFGKLGADSTQSNDHQSSFEGVNLFADGLKKFNLPSDGLWTTPAPKKDEPEENRAEEKGDDDDGGAVATEELPIENFCELNPIEIKTGEEDEDIVFKHRCKLFRFRDKEYKERGLGDIKVLKHRETGKGRLIMRRELVNLVCLNCWSCQNVERMRDTQVRFAGLDASDEEKGPEMTVFLAKFKTPELTDEFMKHLKDLFTEN